MRHDVIDTLKDTGSLEQFCTFYSNQMKHVFFFPHAHVHTHFQFFQLCYEFATLGRGAGGGIAERIITWDTDYLLDKNYVMLL